MRERRACSIVNFSSIGGFVGFAANSYYCAAKHAVEGMSKALDLEVKPLGINVTIIEPGSFQTGFMQVMRHNSPIEIADYVDTAGFYRTVPGIVKLPGDPVRRAKAIYGMVTSENPPLHLPLGKEGYDLSVQEYQYLLDNAEKLKDVSMSADFPEGEHPLEQL
jgi:NAD(P)-dependent dehydrogenase (short-subunit alcohol dehydrogenase family)